MQALRFGRRVGIAIAGGIVVIAGVILAVPLVPGPGILLVLLGLGILSLEFERPRVWLAWLKARATRFSQHAKQQLRARRDARQKGPHR